MAKLADAPDLGSGGAILRGSNPLPGISCGPFHSFTEYLGPFWPENVQTRPTTSPELVAGRLDAVFVRHLEGARDETDDQVHLGA